MAKSLYLKIDGPPLEGESEAAGYEKQIEVLSFKHGIKLITGDESQDDSNEGGQKKGAVVGQSKHAPFEIEKFVDRTSPKLSRWCSRGVHIDEVTLSVVRAMGGEGGKRERFLKYKLEKCRVISVALDGSADPVAKETIAFDYRMITWTYEAMGKGKSPHRSKEFWDKEKPEYERKIPKAPPPPGRGR